ncbi:MAG TPA: hypothetical protein VMU16_15070 [Candidatus Binataceae bacterium]|nr:hypothetical protein [Candidatus Binataceae bacterium]
MGNTLEQTGSTGELDSRLQIFARLGAGDSRIGAWMAAVLAGTALVYSRSLGSGFVYDDQGLIADNRFLADWSFIWKSLVNDVDWFRGTGAMPVLPYYRPFQNVWFALNFHLFGLNPVGWHAALIVLHLIVVLLAFRVGWRLSMDRWTALAASALFALMPVHVPVVAYPSAIGTLLSAAFELAAFCFYLRWQAIPAPKGHQPHWLFLSLASFGGALLSYDASAIFPVLVASHALLFPVSNQDQSFTGWHRARSALTAVWPYALVLAAYFGLRIWVLGFISRPFPSTHMTPMEAILTLPGAITAYTMLLVVPWLAGPAYSLDPAERISGPAFYLPVAGICALIFAGPTLFRRIPHRLLNLFYLAWIAISIVPMLNLRGLYPQIPIQDRYLYLSSFGLCMIVADLAVSFARANDNQAKAALAGTAIVLLVYAITSYSIQQYWHDEIAYFTRCTEQSPNVEIWHAQLGIELQTHGDFKKARDQFEMATKLAPERALNFYDLSLADEKLGDLPAAEQAMIKWLALSDHPPLGGYATLALIADAAGDSPGSEAAIKQAEAMPGGSEAATVVRAQIRLLHGDRDGAEKALRAVLQRDPSNAQARSLIAAIKRGATPR